MSKIYKCIHLLTIVDILFTAVSCKKFVDIPAPTNRLIKSTVFTTDQSATSAILGIYSSIVNSPLLTANLSVATGLSADELSNSSDINFSEFLNNNIQPLNNYNLSIWTAAYQYIYYANSIIEGLDNSTEVSDSTKNRLAGEAKLIRAFCYYYLVNLWWSTPLVLSTGYKENAVLPGTDSATVYQQIITDLKDAHNALTSNYITADRARPNKWAAAALLARVYLSAGDYAKAEQEATSVISSGIYSLPQPATAFLIASPEIIWQLQPKIFTYSYLPIVYIPATSTSIPSYPLSTSLINAFEPNDQRKTNWTKSIVSGLTYYFPYKYKVNSGTTASEYLVIFRLAEQYLIRAEARAQQNNINNAKTDLNVVRTRAGLPATTSNDKLSLLISIEKERQVELFTEWGDRWITLKRTGSVNSILSNLKGANWQPTDKWWPIPQSQIDANPNLSQNDGY